MARLSLWTRRLALVVASGYLLAAGGCLADQYWAGLLGDAITAAAASATGAIGSGLAAKFFPNLV